MLSLVRSSPSIALQFRRVSFKLTKRPYWSDEQRVDTVKFLIDNGYGNRILVSGDMVTQAMHTYKGGPGYIHIPKTIIPMMREKGLTDEQIHAITVDNPARALSIA